MEIMTIEAVVDYLSCDGSNDDFAIRGDNFIPADGKYSNSRYHGDSEDDYGLDLGGVSAIAIPRYTERHISAAVARAKKYGKFAVLLRGQQMNAHPVYNDPGECLIDNNQVVCIIGD